MNHSEVVDLLTTARESWTHSSARRPEYLGDSREQLSWTRPVLTYGLLRDNFLTSPTDLSVVGGQRPTRLLKGTSQPLWPTMVSTIFNVSPNRLIFACLVGRFACDLVTRYRRWGLGKKRT